MVYWSDYIGFDFCEGQYYPNTFGLPPKELGNTISSLSMTFMGLFGVFMNKSPNQLIKGIFGLLIVNGIGSIGFHWTRNYGWNMIDTVPMVMLIGWGSNLAVNEILQNMMTRTRLNILLGNISTTFFMFYMVFTIAITGISGNAQTVFQILFGLPYLVIYGFLAYFSANTNRLYIHNNEIFELVPITAITGIIAFVFWLIDNLACNPATGFINFHVFWHILISYSSYVLIVFIGCLMSDNYSYHVKLSYKLGILPVFTWFDPNALT